MRNFLPVVILALSCLFLLPECTRIETDRPPNVILIISDDQAWTDYGFMGHPAIETPHLDRLATTSLCFTRGYATAPLCSPSLASIITGLYAYEHNITGNDPTFASEQRRYSPEWRVDRQHHFAPLQSRFYENKLLTQYLADAGYRSLQTGKWWLGSWQDASFDAGLTHGQPNLGGRHGDEGLKIGREGLDTIFSFIEQAQSAGQPFFVWYAPFLPHTPHTPPEQLLAKYRGRTDSEFLAKYWAMCEWFDETCGSLIDFIDDKGLGEETLVIYTTDNGWIQKPEGNGYGERSKRSPYEKGIRTPFMLRWTGSVTPAYDTATLVSNIDIVPTVLAAADIEPERGFHGIDLLESSAPSDRKTVFAEAYAHDIASTETPTQSLQHRIALSYPWKLILPDTSNLPTSEAELYNLRTDPDEESNLASSHPDLVSQFQEQIDRWWMTTVR